jgi:ABC-type transporter Mla subunit MlaD
MSAKNLGSRSGKDSSGYLVKLIIAILVVSNIFSIAKINGLGKQINESDLKREEVEAMINASLEAFSADYADRLADTLESFAGQIDQRFDTVNANIDVLVKNVNDFNETVSNLRNALK